MRVARWFAALRGFSPKSYKLRVLQEPRCVLRSCVPPLSPRSPGYTPVPVHKRNATRGSFGRPFCLFFEKLSFHLSVVLRAIVCMDRYMAPEVALGKPYNGAADVYGEQGHEPDIR